MLSKAGTGPACWDLRTEVGLPEPQWGSPRPGVGCGEEKPEVHIPKLSSPGTSIIISERQSRRREPPSWGSDKAGACGVGVGGERDELGQEARGPARGPREDALEEATSRLSLERGQGANQRAEGVKRSPDGRVSGV